MSSDDPRVQAAVERQWKSATAGGLVVLPVLALGALGAPGWMTLGYLILVVVALAAYVLWRRRRARRS